MKTLWFCFLIQSVIHLSTSTPAPEISARSFTNRAHHQSTCHKWNCLNEKLGLWNSTSKESHLDILKSILPEGKWKDLADKVLDTCYGELPQKFSRFCSGQGFLHCVIQNLIDNCPEENLKKNDACSKVSSFASLRYMFSQSRYNNLEIDLPKDRRPEFFLRNYFNRQCCDLPELFNSSLLSECGFSTFMYYHNHELRGSNEPRGRTAIVETTATGVIPTISTEKGNVIAESEVEDPMSCCDISGFVEPSLRSECGFHLAWSNDKLNVLNGSFATSTSSTTTVKPITNIDVKVLPLSCEKEICVFSKLNITSQSGSVDKDAFSRLLDNMSASHPRWRRARARVETQCLRNPPHYDDCEINKILSCTFDVLSENCPYAKKDDPCKHVKTNMERQNVCQISSGKYRPKNRRQFCDVPNLVPHHLHYALVECGVSSVSRLDHVVEEVTASSRSWVSGKYSCKEMTDSAKCALSKMGVLNKYGLIDYFGMKDKIRRFTRENVDWSPVTEVLLAAFTSTPMYSEYCYTPRRMLNVIDTMLMTCPMSKRKVTNKCNRFFTDIADVRKSKN